MAVRFNVSLLLVVLLVFLPGVVSSQVDPGNRPAWILEILDLEGTRLGMVVVAGTSNRGYESGYEYWRFDEEALLRIADQPSLEFAVLAQGSWSSPWVMEALAWEPRNGTVAWVHPSEAAWRPLDDGRVPPVAGASYFGNATLGGLTIQYSAEGPSSLTWFKLTGGAFMELEDGALFERAEPPTDGSWWHGPIVARR